MLPYLIIGGNRAEFWKLTPKTIQIDFEAYRERQKRAAQDRWEVGAYVKAALNTSILVATLADNSTPSKMSKFPDRPFADEMPDNDEQMSEERLQAERLRTYMFLKNLGKKS